MAHLSPAEYAAAQQIHIAKCIAPRREQPCSSCMVAARMALQAARPHLADEQAAAWSAAEPRTAKR